MALIDLFNDFAQQMPSGTKVLLGPEHLAANGAPPRIVWVPSRDRFGSTESVGANPRQLRTRLAGVDVHVWGVDYSATETLLNLALAAIYRLFRGSFELTDEDAGWLDMSALQAKGRVYTFRVRFKVPVTDTPATTGTVTAAPQTNLMSVNGADEDAG